MGKELPAAAEGGLSHLWAGVLLLCAIGAFVSRRLAPQQRHDAWLLVAIAVLVSSAPFGVCWGKRIVRSS